jgi:hypothetical protein
MPPLTRNNGERELQVMIANPARMAHAVATSQQSGTSGQIPGTSSDPTQLATLTGTIQSYPNGPSPNGDQVAGVGHQVLNNAGNPVVFMGNLSAITGGTDLPSNFQDGGFAFVDADGNLPAGYSQSTGLWGFSTPGPTTATALQIYSDWDMSTALDGGFGITVPVAAPIPGSGGAISWNACFTQVGNFATMDELNFYLDGSYMQAHGGPGGDSLTVGKIFATTLDGTSTFSCGSGSVPTYESAPATYAWDGFAPTITGDVFSLTDGYILNVDGPALIAVNFAAYYTGED